MSWPPKTAIFGLYGQEPSEWIISGKWQNWRFCSFYAFFKWSKTISRTVLGLETHSETKVWRWGRSRLRAKTMKMTFLGARGWPEPWATTHKSRSKGLVFKVHRVCVSSPKTVREIVLDHYFCVWRLLNSEYGTFLSKVSILPFSLNHEICPFLRVIFRPSCCAVALQMHRSKQLGITSRLVNFELWRCKGSSWADPPKWPFFAIQGGTLGLGGHFKKVSDHRFCSFYAFFKWSKTISRPRFA